jgi:D-galactarolactone cycloisomerase
VPTPRHHSLAPTRIEVFHYKAALREPIVTSFGSIPARNALLIRIEDRDGAFGWGEVWAKLPAFRS